MKKNHKKGAAIELAVWAVVIATALGALIVTFSMVTINKINVNSDVVKERAIVDTVADAYISHLLVGEGEFISPKEGYSVYEEVNTESEISFKVLGGEQELLRVTLEISANEYTITKWKYNKER